MLLAARAGCGLDHMSLKGNCLLIPMAVLDSSKKNGAKDPNAKAQNSITFVTFCWLQQITRLLQIPEIGKESTSM